MEWDNLRYSLVSVLKMVTFKNLFQGWHNNISFRSHRRISKIQKNEMGSLSCFHSSFLLLVLKPSLVYKMAVLLKPEESYNEVSMFQRSNLNTWNIKIFLEFIIYRNIKYVYIIILLPLILSSTKFFCFMIYFAGIDIVISFRPHPLCLIKSLNHYFVYSLISWRCSSGFWHRVDS
jgi:hypothetical protein